MERQLNLLGFKRLRLIEANENKILNVQWINEQLTKAGFKPSITNSIINIGYEGILIEITIKCNNNQVVSSIEIEPKKQFPLIDFKTIELTGNQLTTQNVKNTILSLIPSSETLKEDIEDIPNQSVNNLNIFADMKKYFTDNFIVNEQLASDSKITVWDLSLRPKKYLIKAYLQTKDKPYYQPLFNKDKKQFKFNSVEALMKSIAKNLGINDLTSQLYTEAEQQDFKAVTDELTDEERNQDKVNQNTNTEQNEEEQEVEQQQERTFNRDINLNKEELELRKQLSKEVLDILHSVNEDYDRTNINVWNLAYSKCKNDKEKDILIQLFLNKKMNVKAEYIDRNFLGLRQWVDQRGFDINKNLGLRFIDNYTSLYPNKEVPSGSLTVLIDLSNRHIISEQPGTNNILFDKQSLLYVTDLYTNLRENYGNVIDIITMYHKVYQYEPDKLTQEKVTQLTNNFKFITKKIATTPMDLAYVMCVNDNDKIRPIVTIETIFSIITDQTRSDIQNITDYKTNVKGVLKDIRQDNKLDSLPDADVKTIRLVQNSLNNVFKDNKEALKDFVRDLELVSGENEDNNTR